jgi:SAM-dependent methyltransferase
MYSDVVELREFYDTALGVVARRLIRSRLRGMWPDVRGQIVLGLGYATPYLRPFVSEAERVLALMPAEQGVSRWPTDGPSVVGLSEEAELPLPDMSIDRVLMVHGLEATEHREELLREIWRVLNGSGRLLIIVPNRRSLWSQLDRTPFGQGQPYSAGQIGRLLRQHLFIPERVCRALYVPPFRSRFLLAGAGAWEEVGSRIFQGLAGLLLVEASKQLYQATRSKMARARQPILIPAGAATPHAARHTVGEHHGNIVPIAGRSLRER